MKLHEEFKLFEDMWEDESTEYYGPHIVKGDTTSYWVEVENSTKKIEAKGVTKKQAFKAIMAFALGLTQEEIDNLSMQWIYDHKTPGDEEGDVILQIESLSEFCEMEECSLDLDNGDRQYFEQNRYPQNWDDEDDHNVAAILTALDLPLWY